MPQQNVLTDPIFSELVDEDLQELVEMFIDELPDRVAAIENSLETKDLAKLATLVHQLKGAAGSYGFPTISDAARRLEAHTKNGDDWNLLANEFNQLVSLCCRARVASPTL